MKVTIDMGDDPREFMRLLETAYSHAVNGVGDWAVGAQEQEEGDKSVEALERIVDQCRVALAETEGAK